MQFGMDARSGSGMRQPNLDASWPPSPTRDTDGGGERIREHCHRSAGSTSEEPGQIDKQQLTARVEVCFEGVLTVSMAND